jgi:cell division protein FtsW
MFGFKFDKILTFSVLGYTIFGFLIFFSAALGVMARYEAKFFNVINNQFFYGLCVGLVAFIVGVLLPYKFWQKAAFVLLPFTFILCLLVFIPSLGVEINGSKSWLSIFGFQFQPSEILKFVSILFLSSYYSLFYKGSNQTTFHRLLPVGILALTTAAVLLQPDFGTGLLIIAGILGVFFLLSAKAVDLLASLGLVAILGLGAYALLPHVSDRIDTFLRPETDTLGKSYQINQAMIAIGSGHYFGEGYNQSLQKYHYLPEPIGDSVFAVIGEEFGFVGSLLVVGMILFIGLRLIYLAQVHEGAFERGVLAGTGVLFLAQSFLNIGSISGATPLTGVPLPLVSHGSTSLIILLGMLGICAQIGGSKLRYQV